MKATRSKGLASEVETLRLRLAQAEEALHAIGAGEVDSVVVQCPSGPKVFALESSHSAYRVLVEAMNDGAVTLAEDHTIVYCNTCFAKLVQAPLSRVMGSSIDDYLGPYDLGPQASLVFSVLLRKVREFGQDRCEMLLRNREGRTVPVHMSVSLLDDGASPMFCLIVTDLSQQKQEVDKILWAMTDGVLVFDPCGRVVRANPAALASMGSDLLGLEPSVLEGKLPLWSPEGRLLAIRELPWSRALRGEALVDVPVVLSRGEEKLRFRVSCSPLFVGAQLTGAVSVWHDVTAVERAREELQRNEARFRAFFENVAVGTVNLSLDGRFTEVNDRFCEIVGYSRAELASMSPLDLSPAEDRQRDRERLGAHLRGERPIHEVTKRYVRKDGKLIWVKVTATMVRDHHGIPLHSAGVVQDVSAQVQAQLDLKQAFDSAERTLAELNAIIDAMPHAVTFGNVRGITRCNSEALRLHGASSPEDLNARLTGGKQSWRSENGALVEATKLPFSLALLGQKACLDTWTTQPRSGESVLIRSSSAPVLVNGRAIGAVAVDIELTDYYRLQEAWREREHHYHTLFELCPSGMVLIARDGHIVEFNQRAHAQLGYEAYEFSQLTVADVECNESAPDIEGRIANILQMGGTVFETRHRSKCGEVRAVVVEARPLEVQGQSRVLAVWRDITDQKRSEQALRDANENKNQFIAMLSHELRNPLAPIRNSLFLLDRVDVHAEGAARARAIINRQVDHMSRIVEDLLDVTRVSRGKIQLQRETVDLYEIARQTVDDFRPAFTAQGISLALVEPGVKAPVWGDPTRLAQVLGNLLHNACKFTPSAGHVTVTVAHEQATSQAVMRVADDGVGIAPEMLAHLFEPFTQADRSLARVGGGLGLGLALVKGLIDLHGGSVAVNSPGPGAGAEFVVRVPLVAQGEAGASAALPPSVEPVRRILVIEDNVDAAESLRSLLQVARHQVEVAYNGPDGIERAHTFRPEVILCDIGLPGMDGYDVARSLRSSDELHDVFLVALTGYGMPEDRRRSAEAGFNRHLTKPADVDAIAQLLRELPEPSGGGPSLGSGCCPASLDAQSNA